MSYEESQIQSREVGMMDDREALERECEALHKIVVRMGEFNLTRDNSLRALAESLFFAHAYNDHVSVGARIDELCRMLKCARYGDDD